MKFKKGSIASSVIGIVMGIVLLTALVMPFLNTAAESNATTTRLGLPVAGYTGLLLLIIVVYIFSLIKFNKKS